ncbi:MAG: hypothetical protein ACI9J2_000949, partial [Saprospiraceae bacterium]
RESRVKNNWIWCRLLKITGRFKFYLLSHIRTNYPTSPSYKPVKRVALSGLSADKPSDSNPQRLIEHCGASSHRANICGST